VRSKHVAAINSKTLRPFIMKNVSRKSTLNTDEAAYYDDPKIVAVDHASKLGREFANHHAVDHSRKAGNISATESPTISALSRRISHFNPTPSADAGGSRGGWQVTRRSATNREAAKPEGRTVQSALIWSATLGARLWHVQLVAHAT
jgi:hypothetical protein